ncbi:hypothetical protein [Streptomyces glaucus]|uniref:Uncharacterized protein n=1 Tax=Streptomyces glaucus TaxID=284029 RepID=A0ABN3JT59_9ACTN
MNEPEITAAEAARKAARFAACAEEAHEALEAFRLGNLQATAERGFSQARIAELRKTVDDMAQVRDELINVANMWANVAGALHLVEGEKP